MSYAWSDASVTLTSDTDDDNVVTTNACIEALVVCIVDV